MLWLLEHVVLKTNYALPGIQLLAEGLHGHFLEITLIGAQKHVVKGTNVAVHF